MKVGDKLICLRNRNLNYSIFKKNEIYIIYSIGFDCNYVIGSECDSKNIDAFYTEDSVMPHDYGDSFEYHFEPYKESRKAKLKTILE